MGIPFPMYPNRFRGLVARAGAGPWQAVDPAAERRLRESAIAAGRRDAGRRGSSDRRSGSTGSRPSRRPGKRTAAIPPSSIVFRSSFRNPSQRGASRVQRGIPNRPASRPRCSSGGPGAGATWSRSWSGRPRSPLSSGTSSACAGPCSTSTSPRSTIPIAPSSPRSCGPGRFSRWCPGLYCGLPLFSESQAGYLHPFKYLLYPWLETWQAFNLDTVLSVWLTGVGTYLWLRRHVGPAGALTGAAVFGLSGYVWGHLIHTSMINALASVPFVIWGLEGVVGSRVDGEGLCWAVWRWPARSSPATFRTRC